MQKSESTAFLGYTLPERQPQKAACISLVTQARETAQANPAHQANSSAADQSIRLLARLLGRQAAHAFVADNAANAPEQSDVG